MKPSFALDFRDGVISLLHRTTRGWQQVGASPLDAPDLADALTYLRSTALGLSPRGLSTKLVLPNDLILYTTVHAPGPEVAKRRKQIKAALEGLTPYKVDDLVFDWWGSGTEVQVAVVARETLAEAEAFAVEHRFNPVSFVGAPENGDYKGEPFFGPSALSATLLGEGEKIDRDQDPVSALPRDFGKPAPEAPVAINPVAEQPPADPVPPAAVLPVAVPVPNALTAHPAAQPVPTLPPERPAATFAPDRPAAIAVPERPAATFAPDRPAAIAVPERPAAIVGPERPAAIAVPERPAAIAVPERPAAPPQPPRLQDSLPDFGAAKAPAAGSPAFDPAKMAVDLVDEAPMAVDVADDTPPPPVMPAEPPVTARPVEPPANPAAPATTAKRMPEPDSIPPPSPTSAVIAAFASRRASDQGAEADKPRKSPSLGPAPQQRPSVARPAMAKPAAPLPTALREAVPFPAKGVVPASKFGSGKAVRPIALAPAGLQIKRNVVQLPKQSLPVSDEGGDPAPAKPSARQATGLDGRPVAPRGKPRYLGWILTGLLLLALALVAAWSSYFLTSNEADPNAAPAANAVAALTPDTPTAPVASDTPTASVASDTPTASGASADATPPADVATPADALAASSTDPLPSPADEALADGQDPATADNTVTAAAATSQPDAQSPDAQSPDALPTLSDTRTPDTATPDTATPDTATPPPATAATATPDTTPAETAALPPASEPAPGTLITTEAAQASAQGNDPQDEIFLAAADTPPQTSDPLVLPQLVSTSDPPPALSAPPPPFGTLYTFDAEGRIQPTPEGIITPEGVLLIAGTPKVVPPARPVQPVQPVQPSTLAASLPAALAASLPATEPAVLGSTAAIAIATAPVPFPSDPALADKRPKARPAGLVDPAAATAKQGEALAPEANSRFAALRPHSRPPALTTQAAVPPDPELANAASAASLALNGVKPSTLAVITSKKPASRPSGMDQAVNAAVAAAVRTPEPDQQVASVAPEAEAEPEVENAALSLPTNASVAKQATINDAINLSRVALLGIFGTSSGRYALIRQAAGGVKKVVVGDSIDGGRIAAITANAVQYQKGGRIVTLSLPTG